MRILGIDYGTRRLGIAISDELCMIATPLKTEKVYSNKDAVNAILKIISEYEISKIVIGMPYNMKGEKGEMTNKVSEFIDLLNQSIKIPTVTIDERLTSVIAEKALREGNVSRKKKKESLDKMAAQLILQSFLDSII